MARVDAAAASSSSSQSLKRPSMGTQLGSLLSLYQSLATLLFALLEQRASTRAGRGSSSTTMGGAAALHAPSLDTIPTTFHAELAHLDLFRGAATAASQSTSIADPASVVQAIRAVDALLARLLALARRHATNQAHIERLVAECRAADGALSGRIRRLARIRDRCERLVGVGREEVAVMERAEKKPLDYRDVLAYAGRLSQTTTAPAGFTLPTHADDDDDDDDQKGGDAGGGEDGQQGEGKSKKKKKPIYATEDVDGAQPPQFRGQDLVPPELLDKLPFPSVSAMRKGVVEMPFPTWEAFRQAQLEEEAGPMLQQGQIAGAAPQQQQQRQSQAQAQRQVQPPPPASMPAQQRKPPAEEDDDGFGLDLS